MKNFFIALAFSTVFLPLAHAVELVSPYQVVETTGDKLFTRISSQQNELSKFPELMREIVDEELMPVIDYRYAAYKILGANLRKISDEQRNKFVDSMRSYLVRTYATALNQYKNQKVNYEPIQDTGSKKIVSVGATIIETNKPEIHMVFMMRHDQKAQEWKAFDLIVEGISLLSSKQAELNSRIAKYGIDQVTLELSSVTK
ncbi:MlaC/ttg2D family ABC transporter substrate-binding protein [Thalassotalea profundi]|uniref:Toluene tolerance protein n=1 Tax=Thalassotalea profundi TaxID=2036687 RepID=A0ABQ3IG21_9GAMM|nr:ABC transporter substrate-binding protein [Thalassotalea profundi]GHE76754.1 toluene tolerance protein [Thalassotalea profundi]